jgi:hypothetical protein
MAVVARSAAASLADLAGILPLMSVSIRCDQVL